MWWLWQQLLEKLITHLATYNQKCTNTGEITFMDVQKKVIPWQYEWQYEYSTKTKNYLDE